MKPRIVVCCAGLAISTFLVLSQQPVFKPAGKHYSAAFFKDHTLVIFPYNNSAEVRVPLPGIQGVIYSNDGSTLYGIVGMGSEKATELASINASPIRMESVADLSRITLASNIAVSSSGEWALISGKAPQLGVPVCSLFKYYFGDGRIQQIIPKVNGGECGPLGFWSGLSLSLDGTHAVGGARGGKIGVVDLDNRRVERIWPGLFGIPIAR